MKLRNVLVIGLVAVSLAGCTTMKNMWPWGNKNDDTILPGVKENVLSENEMQGADTKRSADAVGQPDAESQTTEAQKAPANIKTAKKGTLAPPTEPACEPSDSSYPDCLTPDALNSGIDEESPLEPQ